MSGFQIAVIVETMNSYGRGILGGICSFLQESPKCTIFYEERTLDTPPPDWLLNWKGDGIIVRDREGDCCKIALETGAKVVDLSENRLPGVPTVYTNHEECSRLAAEHFLSCGFRNFAFIGIADRPFSNKRRDAFVKAVGGNCPVFEFSNNKRALPSWSADHSPLSNWLNKLPKPVGIMTCYDMVGVRTLQACNQAGISVPEKVAVLGVNNDEYQCLMTNPPMSSVEQNPRKIGYEACALLYRLMKGEAPPETPMIVSPTRIIPRQSTDILVVSDQLVVKAVQRIREQACSGVSVKEIAAQLQIPRRTLERRFAKHLHKTIRQEIIDTQIRKAHELLLTTSLPLKNVGKNVGFLSFSYFNSLFTKMTGEKPSDYRRNKRPY